MFALLCFVLAVLASPFKSRSRLEAENAALRHQLIVLRREVRGRPRLTNNDRWFLVQLYRWFPSILQALTIIRPETLVRWHRAGFRCYWRWKSRSLGGRPQIETDLRALIRRMSSENPLWGAPRIHGELLKLGFGVAQSSVAKYMVKRRGPPSQGWRRPQRPRLDQRHDKPDGRMDRASNNRGISLGWCPATPHSRSGLDLRHHRRAPTARHGYPGQAYCTSLALAEWLCRTADRINPARNQRVCRKPCTKVGEI